MKSWWILHCYRTSKRILIVSTVSSRYTDLLFIYINKNHVTLTIIQYARTMHVQSIISYGIRSYGISVKWITLFMEQGWEGSNIPQVGHPEYNIQFWANFVLSSGQYSIGRVLLWGLISWIPAVWALFLWSLRPRSPMIPWSSLEAPHTHYIEWFRYGQPHIWISIREIYPRRYFLSGIPVVWNTKRAAPTVFQMR